MNRAKSFKKILKKLNIAVFLVLLIFLVQYDLYPQNDQGSKQSTQFLFEKNVFSNLNFPKPDSILENRESVFTEKSQENIFSNRLSSKSLLSSAGTDLWLPYSTYIGGSNDDFAHDIVIDKNGFIYITGATRSSNFPVNQSSYNTTFGGNIDTFVMKFTPDGGDIIYSTYVGGSDQDWATSIAVDESGNAFVTGYTYSSNFPSKLFKFL